MVSALLFRQHETDVSLRCLIVDDNAGFREEVRGLLEEQGIEVVGGAGTGAEAVQQVAELRPEVALVDIDLGGESGLDLARRLRDGGGSAVPIVILISTHDEREYADLIDSSPAAGFADCEAGAVLSLRSEGSYLRRAGWRTDKGGVVSAELVQDVLNLALADGLAENFEDRTNGAFPLLAAERNDADDPPHELARWKSLRPPIVF